MDSLLTIMAVISDNLVIIKNDILLIHTLIALLAGFFVSWTIIQARKGR